MNEYTRAHLITERRHIVSSILRDGAGLAGRGMLELNGKGSALVMFCIIHTHQKVELSCHSVFLLKCDSLCVIQKRKKRVFFFFMHHFIWQNRWTSTCNKDLEHRYHVIHSPGQVFSLCLISTSNV